MALETVEDKRTVIDDAHVPVAESRVVHKPFVPASKWLPEFTARAVLVGSGLGIIFGAASLYISLKTGLTFNETCAISDYVDIRFQLVSSTVSLLRRPL